VRPARTISPALPCSLEPKRGSPHLPYHSDVSPSQGALVLGALTVQDGVDALCERDLLVLRVPTHLARVDEHAQHNIVHVDAVSHTRERGTLQVLLEHKYECCHGLARLPLLGGPCL
jgi:hypothetical protein